MKKHRGSLFVFLLLASFIMGLVLARGMSYLTKPNAKPVVPVEISRQQLTRINPETPVVLEQIFHRCSHRVIGEFAGKDELVGQTIKDLSGSYAHIHGYLISVSGDGTVTVSEQLDALCPACQKKRHLTVKDGKLGVYKGPVGYDREMLSITGIEFGRLPAQVQQDIKAGKLEFVNQDELNYGLESLEEYER